jgi:hypothetical protein
VSQPRLAWCLALCASLVAVACANPRDDPGGSNIVGTGRDGGGGGAGGGGGPADGPAPPGGDGGGSITCAPGSHVCGSDCVDDRSTQGCGMSCQPCPAIKGGTPSCDGTICGGACPENQKLCHGECIAAAAACTGACAAGSHDCNGACADDKNVNSCGPTACTACPVPAGATATCDGGKCDFSCGALKRCADRCGACCADADCAAKPGQVATCELATHTCKGACDADHQDCNGSCIPKASCCKDADCPMKNGQVGKCDSGSGACSYSCAGTMVPCNGGCIPAGGCCKDADCPPPAGKAGTCNATTHACSYACTGATRDCNGSCIPTTGSCCGDAECKAPAGQVGSCDAGTHQCHFACGSTTRDCGGGKCVPLSNGCCTDTDCGACKRCSNSVCVNQAAGDDLKNDCPPSDCHTGACNGQGACGVDPNGSNGHNCAGTCQSCQGGSCTSKSSTTVCMPRTCFNGNVVEGRCMSGSCGMQTVQTCNANENCMGSSCVATCGDEGKLCCPSGANQGCAAGLFCDDRTAMCKQKLPTNTDCTDSQFNRRDDWCKSGYCNRASFCQPCGHIGENCCTSGTANCVEGFCNNNCPKNMLSPNDKDSQCEAAPPDSTIMCLIF